jgi:RimJ/RimL family protein N-acetyltransferase
MSRPDKAGNEGAMMRVSIRSWQLSDAADVAALINNKKVQDNLRDGIPYPYLEKDGEEFIASMLNARQGSIYAFAIIADEKVAGSIGAFRQANNHSRTAEMGYYVGEEFWGKGVCTEAVKLACRYVFENSDIIRIYAEPFAYNTASCRVLEKAGFQFEGTLRSNAVKNGKIRDMRMYSIIRPDMGLEA